MKLAIIDTLGLTYDGSTLQKRGLGGSESAVILISKELQKLNIDVTVFNDCESDDSLPGIYNGVNFRPLKDVEQCEYFDIVIASRSVAPFAPSDMIHRFKTHSYLPDFTNIQKNSGYKILWMHDTFCDGDDLIEPFIIKGLINEIFTLSDWHTSYVSTCDHGIKRNFDILKHNIFQTRNGIGFYNKEWVDIKNKDKNLFVFNASVTKGMIPLVENIWPKVKEKLPEAKLKVIGGYYRFRSGSTPDEQELKWRTLVDNNPDIDFTGIISQKEISDILTKASYMIYPAGFPETFGISTLEALAHNVPLITCRFGALEETALDIASYKINYPVEPNWALPWLNKEDQINRFVDMVIHAYNNTYLHQQKMYACNQVKDICFWDSVALQWKQHLYKRIGLFLPVNEYRKVQIINYKVRELFNRRFYNLEEKTIPLLGPENKIVIITPTYNSEDYINRCILSIAQQDYDNYELILINDCSTDNTHNVIEETIKSLPISIQNKINYKNNTDRKGAVRNQYEAISNFKDHSNCIFMLIDGDDWLINDPQIFRKYNNIYLEGYDFTYGSCWSVADGIPLIAQEYPPEIKNKKDYRSYKFNWNMPYTHLRTFSSTLFSHINENDWKIDNMWPMAGGDNIVFYTLLEAADPQKVKAIPEIMYNYNDLNPLNDYKVNTSEQTETANKVLNKKIDKKYSVIIPSMWRCPELTLKQINVLEKNNFVNEIIIINNDKDRTPLNELSKFKKIKLLDQETNIGVNPAWNLGVKEAKNELLCIMNDDIIYDDRIFEKLVDKLYSGSGPFGLINSDISLGQPPMTDKSINFIEYKNKQMCIHCFGQLFFIHKSDWIDIPSELIINFGDDFIFHTQLTKKKNKIHLIYNMDFYSPCSQTVSDKSISLISKDQFEKEQEYYNRFVEGEDKPMKKILIGIPTARYIEPDTFKSIYDLQIPEGYEVTFQYFYGYNVDQVRNLIADWTINGFDYLFSVDHDITFPPDTLVKLINADKDIVCGVYRQRNENQILEIYDQEYKNIPIESIYDNRMLLLGGCGFGCVLVKKEVFVKVGYPQFEYHSAINHKDTFSEDLDFCRKAINNNFTIWCDTSILCGHHGSKIFNIQPPKNSKSDRFNELMNMDLLPAAHKNYLKKLSESETPKVIYDIGSSVLHWTNFVKNNIWPDAQIIPFEAMSEIEQLYKDNGISTYCLGNIVSDTDNEIVKFYQNLEHPGGNSIFKENSQYSINADLLFPEEKAVYKTTKTIDSLVNLYKLPLPDMIKLDVQGSELKVLKGAKKTLNHVKHIIIEGQNVEYNKGAPGCIEVFEYLNSIGFKMVFGPFEESLIDGDYHFAKV